MERFEKIIGHNYYAITYRKVKLYSVLFKISELLLLLDIIGKTTVINLFLVDRRGLLISVIKFSTRYV